jgi:hypothetical protein
MRTSTIALLLSLVIAAPASAHERGLTMLKDAAVNHDFEKAKRQFEQLVNKSDVSARTLQDR